MGNGVRVGLEVRHQLIVDLGAEIAVETHRLAIVNVGQDGFGKVVKRVTQLVGSGNQNLLGRAGSVEFRPQVCVITTVTVGDRKRIPSSGCQLCFCVGRVNPSKLVDSQAPEEINASSSVTLGVKDDRNGLNGHFYLDDGAASVTNQTAVRESILGSSSSGFGGPPLAGHQANVHRGFSQRLVPAHTTSSGRRSVYRHGLHGYGVSASSAIGIAPCTRQGFHRRGSSNRDWSGRSTVHVADWSRRKSRRGSRIGSRSASLDRVKLVLVVIVD